LVAAIVWLALVTMGEIGGLLETTTVVSSLIIDFLLLFSSLLTVFEDGIGCDGEGDEVNLFLSSMLVLLFFEFFSIHHYYFHC
jgi:hypothetical protein